MPISFQEDVRPLFRPDDLDCMSGIGVSLDDFTYMSNSAGNDIFPDHANARNVLAHLTGVARPRMPMGGPYWTDAQITTFQQWMDDGFAA
jgi:hypothetical protein